MESPKGCSGVLPTKDFHVYIYTHINIGFPWVSKWFYIETSVHTFPHPPASQGLVGSGGNKP